MIKTENLFLAQLRYYSMDYNGSEILPIKAYVVLEKTEDGYVNLFNKDEVLPVYRRESPNFYRNYTFHDDLMFGTKIILDEGEEKNGLCYIMDMGSFREIFRKDEVSLDEVKKFVSESPLFFYNRVDMLEDSCEIRRLSAVERVRHNKDIEMKCAFDEYIRENYGAKKNIKK